MPQVYDFAYDYLLFVFKQENLCSYLTVLACISQPQKPQACEEGCLLFLLSITITITYNYFYY